MVSLSRPVLTNVIVPESLPYDRLKSLRTTTDSNGCFEIRYCSFQTALSSLYFVRREGGLGGED